MAAPAKKKNKTGKTLTLAEDSGGNTQPSYLPTKPTSWADETDDLEGDVSTSWHSEDDAYRAPAIDCSMLPTAPRAAREPNVDRSRLPRSPPYTAFLGNLPYDVTEDSIKDLFRGLSISAVRLPSEPSNPERLKGFGYAEFDDVDSLLRALSLNEENLGNRRIRVDIADQSNEKERDERGGMSGRGRGSDSGPDKTESDWRARPSSEANEGPPPRRDDTFGERSRGRFESDRFRNGPRRDNDRYDGGRERFRDRHDNRDRRDDRGSSSYDSRSGGGRRAFGSGFQRDYDDRRGGDDFKGSGDRYGDRYGDREDRFERREERGERAAPIQRPKLNLKPRSVPKEEEQGNTPPSQSRSASIFGGAKPVDTAAKEREVEERLKKEQEKLQRQLGEEKGRGPERKPRERHPSWHSEDQPERSRTGSESSQPGSTSGRAGPTRTKGIGGPKALARGTEKARTKHRQGPGTHFFGPVGERGLMKRASSTGSRRRESERSVENEVFGGRDEEPPSPGSQPPSSKQEGLMLKLVPAPPPKENAWAKRSARSAGSSDGEARPAVSPSTNTPSSTSPTDEQVPQTGKDENQAGGVRRDRGPSRGRGGATARGDAASRDRRKEADRKAGRRERNLRPAPEPKRYEESPSPKFSSASKYAALLTDGEEAEESAE